MHSNSHVHPVFAGIINSIVIDRRRKFETVPLRVRQMRISHYKRRKAGDDIGIAGCDCLGCIRAGVGEHKREAACAAREWLAEHADSPNAPAVRKELLNTQEPVKTESGR